MCRAGRAVRRVAPRCTAAAARCSALRWHFNAKIYSYLLDGGSGVTYRLKMKMTVALPCCFFAPEFEGGATGPKTRITRMITMYLHTPQRQMETFVSERKERRKLFCSFCCPPWFGSLFHNRVHTTVIKYVTPGRGQ